MSEKDLKDIDCDKYKVYPGRRFHTFMSPEDVAAGKKSHWPELEITGVIRNLSPALWTLSHLRGLYLNDNCLERLPPGIRQLECLTILDLSSNKLCSLPAEVGELVLLRELYLNFNLLKRLPYELGKLFRLTELGLLGNPLPTEILNLYTEPNGVTKLLTYLLDNLVFSAVQPPQRPWLQVAHMPRSPSAVFTVMCYNVLCDKYATRQVYGYCPTWALNWEYRRKGIMDEIRHYSADIISLQEVEMEQYHGFFLPELKKDGYDGIFAPKSRARTMAESERRHVDGCAIFFRTSKFALLRERLVEFNQLAMANADGSEDMLNRVMTRDNIGLAALLQFQEGALDYATTESRSLIQQLPPLLVCTAHIHWDPEFCDVKLIQTMMLMRELHAMVDDVMRCPQAGAHRKSGQETPTVPLLLCGDLNSLPDSGVIEYLKKGRVSADHKDFKSLGYKSCLRKMCQETDSLIGNSYTHPFKIQEAYPDGTMPYTNYTCDFKGVIDYIFFSRSHLSVLGVLGPLDPQWMQENKVVGCPHPHVPSDHLPLLAQFEMPLMTNGLLQRR